MHTRMCIFEIGECPMAECYDGYADFGIDFDAVDAGTSDLK